MANVQVYDYEMVVMEIPTVESRFYAEGEVSIYVQRVGDRICFYEGGASDTDIARNWRQADYAITARALARVVERLKAKADTDELIDDRGYLYGLRDGIVTWRARCMDVRRVNIEVLEAVLERFGD